VRERPPVFGGGQKWGSENPPSWSWCALPCLSASRFRRVDRAGRQRGPVISANHSLEFDYATNGTSTWLRHCRRASGATSSVYPGATASGDNDRLLQL
jgi:hypothetical protein